MTYTFDPLVPRPIDRPTEVPRELTPQRLVALDDAKVFAAPERAADRPAWRARLHAWREDARARHRYDGSAYERPEAAWAARCHAVAQVWLWDELLYSFEERRFTPERFLDDARERFGGLDAVVLWHAYPVIGLDDRNQWDHYRQVPGLRDLVDALHAAGVRVFVDYNPWDVGTRRGADDVTELAALVADLDADGVFLDTLKKAEPELVERLEAARPGVVLEGESKLAVERIEDHSASWAQFFADSPVPGVLRAHWYERRHMQHHVRRWHRDHSEELRSAWLNGVGVMVWEVVFGVWVGWSPRDAATVARMTAVQRAAGDLLLEGEWTPLAELDPAAEAAGVYASRWERDGLTLWTLANRSDRDHTGAVLPGAPRAGVPRVGAPADGAPAAGLLMDEAPPDVAPVEGVPADGALTDGVLFDLTGGGRAADGRALVPARGIAALLHVAQGTPVPEWLPGLLAELGRRPHDPDARFRHRLARRLAPPVPAAPAAGSGPAADTAPAGGGGPTVSAVPATGPSENGGGSAVPAVPASGGGPAADAVVIAAGPQALTEPFALTEPSAGGPGPEADTVVVPAGPYVLTVRYRARETGMYQGAPYVDEWKPLPPRLHDARVLQRDGELERPVAVAATEVTEAEFAAFLAATGYVPAQPHRFLAHWRDGRPAPGTEGRPVTFVDLDDARAYCAWRGGRLPTEDEWQLAGEAGGLSRGEPAVWNWTESEHSDGRTRFVMLKGGSDHTAEGSEWYVEGGRRGPEYSLKLLLPGLGQARSATVGFRCAWDLGGAR